MRKTISAILAVLMIFSAMNISVLAAEVANSQPTITVGSIEKTVEVGDTISIPVSISNNPGFCSYTLTASWDTNAFEACAPLYTVGDVLPEGAKFTSGTNANMTGTGDTTENGTLFTINLKVKSVTHKSSVSVSLVGNNVINNAELEKLTFNFAAGEATAHVFGKNNDDDYIKNAADCENSAVYYKSCSCGKTSEDTFVSGGPLGHLLGDVTFTWATDYSTATATRTCTREGCTHAVSTDATVTHNVVTPVSCTEDGTTAHTATATVSGTEATETENQTIAAHGHTREIIPAVPATTHSKGYTEGVKCTVCKNTIVTPQEIEQLTQTDATKEEIAITVEDDATESTSDIPATIFNQETGEQETKKPVTIDMGDFAQIEFDSNAVNAISSGAGADNITLSVTKPSVEDKKEDIEKAGITGAKSVICFELTNKDGDEIFNEESASGEVTLTVNYTIEDEDAAVLVYYIKGSTKMLVPATYENGKLTVTISHFSDYVIVEHTQHSFVNSVCTECGALDENAKFYFKVESGNAVQMIVGADYNATILLPQDGTVNVGAVTFEIILRNIAGLNINGTKSHSATVNTGFGNKEVDLKTWLSNAYSFDGATLNVSIDGKEVVYTLSDIDENGYIAATTDEEAARTAWQALTSHVNTLNQEADDSYVEIANGSYIKVGTEYLRFADGYVGNLKLDDFDDLGALETAIREAAYLDSCEDQGGNLKLFLKADTKISVGQTVATLNGDYMIVIGGDEEEFENLNGKLADLRDTTSAYDLVQKMVKLLDEVILAVDTSETVSVATHNHVCNKLVVSDKYIKTPATEQSSAVYYKSCSICGEAGEETVAFGNPLDHDFGAPEWTWSKDCKTASAKFTCSREDCDAEAIVEATVTADVTTPSTCEKNGIAKYTAKVTFLGQEYTDTTGLIQNVEKLPHTYGKAVFTWADDGKSATAECVCTQCNKAKLSGIATVTSAEKNPATCYSKGTTTYTATIEINNKTETDYKDVQDISTIAHTYGDPVFSWAADGSSATVEITCTVESCGHKESGNAEISSRVTIDPTCYAKGTTTYTAELTLDGVECSDELKLQDVASTAHNYGEAKWTWADDGKSADVEIKCTDEKCSHTESGKADIAFKEKTPASCTDKGTTTYTGTIVLDGKTYSDTKDVADIDMISHAFVDHICTACGAVDENARFFLKVESGNAVQMVVGSDYNATFILPADGTVNAGSVTLAAIMQNISGLGITGTKSYTVTVNTGFGDKAVDLTTWLENTYSFDGAKVKASVDGNSVEYTFAGIDVNGKIQATTDSANAKTAWQALTSHILTSEQEAENSYIVIANGSYLKIGTEYLRFEDEYEGNLKLDDFSDMDGIASAIKAAAKLDTCDDQNGTIKLFLKAGTKIAVGQTVATLKDDYLVAISGDAEEFAKLEGKLTELQGTQSSIDLVKKMVELVDEIVLVVDTCGEVNVATHVHVFNQKNTDSKYLKTAATEGNPAVYYYSCVCGEKGTETFESNPADHNYGEAVFTWAADNKTATAKIVCTDEGCDDEISGIATITSTVMVTATCTRMGTTQYVATVLLNGKEYTDVKAVKDIAKAEHEYATEYTIDKEATTEEKGEKSIHCLNCDARKNITELPVITFTDLAKDEWYTDSVGFVINRGLFNGISDTEFAPDETMTRGMLVTVLWRMSGKPVVESETKFTDLTEDWYAEAVKWASANGIVNGTSETTFEPDNPITREQMAKLFYEYAKYCGHDVTATTDLTVFSDYADITGWGDESTTWAVNSLKWAVASELMKGAEGKLDPSGAATRAQVATIIMRYMNLAEDEEVTFADVSENDWYFDAVNFAVNEGLFNGTGDGSFSPEDTMTKAMFVTVLWRYAGQPEVTTEKTLTNLTEDWYKTAVIWAEQCGVIESAEGFEPNINITREEMAKLLYELCKFQGYDVSKTTDLTVFPDAEVVSTWAVDAMTWAVAEGIINGSDGMLVPGYEATRAQVATIFMRFCGKYN